MTYDYSIDKNKLTGSLSQVFDCLNIQGIILSNENDNHPLSVIMDKECGIDAFIKDEIGVYGVACRLQEIAPSSRSFDSFSIRSQRHSGTKTELEKRNNAINNDYFFPQKTLQAYMRDGEVLSAAIMRTKDLYDFLKHHKYLVKENHSDNDFKIAYWSSIELCEEYPIKIYKKDFELIKDKK